MRNIFTKAIISILFFLVFSNFTILDYHVEIIDEIAYLILLCSILYIFYEKKININQFAVLKPLLIHSSIFYVIIDEKHKIIYIDDRYKEINELLGSSSKNDAIHVILKKFGINEIFVENILSSIKTNFEININCEPNNLNIETTKLQIKNINLKTKKNQNLNLLLITDDIENNLIELCDHYKFSYIKLNNKFDIICTNKFFNKINQYIDANDITKLISQSIFVENELSSNKQNIFLYEKNNNKFNIFTFKDIIWNASSSNFESNKICVISKESINQPIDSINHDYFWQIYFENNKIPIIKIKDSLKIIKSNIIFKKNFQKESDVDQILTKYIEFQDNDVEFFINEMSIIHGISKLNNESILLYCQKINISNEIIIYIIEQSNKNTNSNHDQKIQIIGQLVSGVAHDFNNLLTAMLGFSDLLLLKHPAGDPSFPELTQIKQNVVRGINLVNTLLTFSRKKTSEKKIINVNDVIFNLSDLLKRLINKNITLKIHHNQIIELIEIDQGQLEQIIINIIINAKDAIENSGEINISVYQKYISEELDIDNKNKLPLQSPDKKPIKPDEYIVIKIQDNGIGIKNKSINKIFEPFYSTKQINQGTGLGLSIVRNIIKQNNGYIYFSTKNNYGTIFYILFKKIYQKTIDIENNNKAQISDLTSWDKILIIEDDDSVRLFISEALKIKGYDAISTQSPEKALKILQSIQINLIITDIMMPKINGYELIKQITKLNIKKPKILLISGHDINHDEIEKNTNYTINDIEYDFLNKPFNMKELITRIKRINK